MENLCKLCAGTLPQPQQEQHLITTITSPSGGKHNKCKCTNENECSSQMSETTLTLDRDPVVAVPLNPTLVGLIKEIFPFCVSSVKVNPNREGQTVGAQDFENDGDGIEPKTPFHLKEPSICSYCHQLLYQTIEFFGKVRSGQRALTSLKSAANHKKRGRPKKLMSQQSPIEPISDSPLVNPSSRPKRTIHPPPRYGSPLLSSEEQDPSQHQKPDSNSEPQQNQLNPEPTYNLMSILGPVPPLQPQLDVIMEGDEEVDTVVAPPVSVVESEDSDKDQYENEPEDEFVPGKRSQSQARRRQQKPKKRRHKTLASASPVICQVCNVRLKFKSSLIQHMRNHESTSSGDPNILPHACSYCSKRFNHRGNLASHERSHIGSRPYSCKVDGCGRAFVTNSQLKKHTNLVHLGLKLWLCPICGQTFGQKDGLVRHTNLRHSEKEPEVDGSLIPDENTNSISNNGQVVYVLHEIQDFELNELSTVTVTTLTQHVVHKFSDHIIAYAPKTKVTAFIMSKVAAAIEGNVAFNGFNTEEEIEIFIVTSALGVNRTREASVRAAVIFTGGLPKEIGIGSIGDFSYKIRLVDQWALDNTKELWPLFQSPGPDNQNAVSYINAGFIGIQIAVDKALIQLMNPGIEPRFLPDISLQSFPYPPYKATMDFNLVYYILVPQLMVLGFIFLVPSLIRNIVSEKETGIKELMKLMGLPNWTHWFGWMASSMVILGLNVTIIVAIYFIPFDSGTGAVIIFSNPTLWWVVLMLYAMSAAAFCFFVSIFFHKPTLGTTVGIILWLVSYYVPVQVLEAKYSKLSFVDKLFSALLPNVALHWATKAMCSFEARSIGARWSNLFEPVNSVDSLSVGSMCIMFIVDTIILISLTIYLENILPSAFGLRKPWWYPIKHFVGLLYSNSNMTADADEFDNDENSSPPGFEPDPSNLEASIILNELSKRWGTKVAVDSLNLKIYSGQITALLGHNGAGKTTTMSMLTGLFAPTSGTAWIRGFNIRTDMDSVRRSLGLCPQNNMLFNHLTVEEHLEFFARLKGLGAESTQVEVKGLLEQLQLADKKRTLAWALSGGQKRKLSLGIALVGRPDVIILDEPTSGMDPEARRAVWDLLLRYRGGHEQSGPGPLILLSTHFMEEADVLGDRIAIMSAGRVKCCGSPLFLKKWYGTGYTLKMTLDSARPELTSRKILQLIQTHVPQAVIKEDRGGQEVFISLPPPAESEANEGMDADRPDGNLNSKKKLRRAPDTSAFPSLFQTLEEAKGTLGIRTIGLSLTTMDEVFVKVGESDSVDSIGKPSYGTSNPTKPIKSPEQSDSQKFNSDFQLRISQFRGLFTKRVLYTLRSRKLAIAQFLLPVATLIVTIWLSNQSFEPSQSAPPLEMKLGDYKDAVTIWSVSGEGKEALSKAFTSALQSSGSKSSIRVGADVQAALIDVGVQDLATYREKYILAGQLNSTHFQALFSSIPNHAAPLATNIMSNTMLKHSGPFAKNAKITITSHPLEGAYYSLLAPAEANPFFSTVVPILFGVLVPLGLALYSASAIVFPVEEKINKAKQLQLMTGTSPLIYWLSSWAWDGLVLGLLVCIMTLCLPIFQSYGAFTVYHGGGVFFLILITYGFSSISFSYLCSLFVSTVPGGFSLVTIIHLVTGMIMSLVVFLLENHKLRDEASNIRFFGRFFPTFGASLSIMRFTSIATKNSRCNILSEATKNLICNPSFDIQAELRSCCSNCKDFKLSELSDFLEPSPEPTLHCFRPQPYLVWETQFSSSFWPKPYSVPGIGQDLTYLFLIGIVYKVLLLLWEYGLFQRIFGALILKSGNRNTRFPKESEDEDVKLETRRVDDLVDSGRVNEDALVVQHFCKNFGSLAAVSNLSFGVHYGEVFGLLGVNGAGKTTSFRMLTGDEVGNFGNAWASMYNLLNQRSKFLSQIGYCPQFDGIVGVLTGTEMLELFARLRGIRGDIVREEVENWIRQLGLYDARNVQCMKYSGGMKRRLSAAMALIGDSPIILLDEPTSGVDPIARRQFWEVISSVRSAGQAVVLTSHSMEECEALCSRLGIMVNGQFQCLGGVQHLKSKFALGFSLVLKLKSPSSQISESQEFQNLLIQELESEISMKFAPANLKDKHQNLLQFQVLNTSLGWGQLFTWMEEIKCHSKYSEILEDYTVSETTLEEVFLSFARKQYPEGAREANLSWWRKLCS